MEFMKTTCYFSTARMPSNIGNHPEEAITLPLDSPFDQDLSQIIHSSSFRRLQGKTQVWGVYESDFFRTRLTHSLEAAQIGSVLAKMFDFPSPLIVAACLAHDIGHPPFGHEGADIINDFAIKVSEGEVVFSDNAQNLRVLCRLASKEQSHGLNLTAAVLDSLLKYKSMANTKNLKAGYYPEEKAIFDWVVSETGTGLKRHPAAMLLEIADDVAYATHDLEDAMRALWITKETIQYELGQFIDQHPSLRDFAKECFFEPMDTLNKSSDLRSVKYAIKSRLIKYFFRELYQLKGDPGLIEAWQSLNYPEENEEQEAVNLFYEALPHLKAALHFLKGLNKKYVIEDPNSQTQRFASLSLLGDYLKRFEPLICSRNTALERHSLLSLPLTVQARLRKSEDRNERLRHLLDYISGMTDTYLFAQAALFHNPSPSVASPIRK